MTPEPSEPHDATIVTRLASPPKRHCTIRHALRWNETAQGTTRERTAERIRRRTGFSRVARARDGTSVDRAEARGSALLTRPSRRISAIGGQLGGPPHSIPTASRTRVGASRGSTEGSVRGASSRVRAPRWTRRRVFRRSRRRASSRHARHPRRTPPRDVASGPRKPSAGAGGRRRPRARLPAIFPRRVFRFSLI